MHLQKSLKHALVNAECASKLWMLFIPSNFINSCILTHSRSEDEDTEGFWPLFQGKGDQLPIIESFCLCFLRSVDTKLTNISMFPRVLSHGKSSCIILYNVLMLWLNYINDSKVKKCKCFELRNFIFLTSWILTS